MRAYRRHGDLAAVAAVAGSCIADGPHSADVGWRLANPSWQSARDCRVVTDGGGAVIGFAAWQQPWAVLDLWARPGRGDQAYEELLSWAAGRFAGMDRERGYPLAYWAEAHEGDAGRLGLLARHGYVLDGDPGLVLRHGLRGPVPPAPMPAGFALRSFAGPSQVPAYVRAHRQAFGTSSMTARWRLATLTMPGYHPALDLAAVAPDGSLAGFCVAWLGQASATAHIEPLGISPGLRRLGLGHAMVTAVLGRARDCGARVVTVQTGAVHGPAVAFYQQVGFEAACRVLRKGQWFPAQPG